MRSGLVVLLLAAVTAAAQVRVQAVAAGDVPVVMLSDLHFDPFRDEAKVERLDKAPVSEWEAILKEPASAGWAAAYQTMQTACAAAKLPDTDYALLDASLKAAAKQAGGSKFSGFVTVSGDLQVHQFECRYKKSTGKTDFMEFAVKTTSYVMGKVQAEFAGAPVYIALGNNDSGCGDYALDMHDAYFAGTSAALLHGLKNASEAELKQAKEDWETSGNYAVTLPGTLSKTRLVVIDDMYLSSKYSTCGGKKDKAGAMALLAWMAQEFDAARQKGETVWVLGHIPPGTDVYSTMKHVLTMCGRAAPDMFLANTSLGDLLTKNEDVVKLAIFGHTHSDEFRLFGDVPMKGVGSITPVNGNMPSFTVGEADANGLKDYSVYVASNTSGVGTKWTREYGFDETYHSKSFSGAALAEVVARLQKDKTGESPESRMYEQAFFPGGSSPLGLVWPQYVCSMKDAPGAEIVACMCPKQ
jgi:sphingomyelin phosphodiesterase acid-like 3